MSIIEVNTKTHLSFQFPDNRVEGQVSNWTQKIFVDDGQIFLQLYWGDKTYPTYSIPIALAEWNKGMKLIGAAALAKKK